jgi:hypothetical protein
MKKIVIATLALTLSTAVFANKLPNIDGMYTCSVNDAAMANHHTSGKFSLYKTGNVYHVTQLNAENQPITNEYQIFAIRSGNVLSFAYQNIKDPKIFGTEIMHISKDGKKLRGTFAYSNHLDKENSEVCKRI